MSKTILTLLSVMVCRAEAAELVPGATWNESKAYTDSESKLKVRQVTTAGLYNRGPTYHLNTGFSKDSRYFIFATMRQGRTALMRADTVNGDIKVLFVGPELKHYDELKPKAALTKQPRLEGNLVALSQETGKAAVVIHYLNDLYLVDIYTGKAKKLIDHNDHPSEVLKTPSFSKDGSRLIVPIVVDPDYTPYRQKKTYPMTYFAYNVEDGSRQVFYDEKNWGHAHLQENPRKKDQWLTCLGRPAWLFSGKARGIAKIKAEKMNIYNSRTGKKYVVKPHNKYKEVSHPSFNYAGDRIIYHGQPKKGMFIGAVDLSGNTIWEHVFTNWRYHKNGSNHLGAHTRNNIIIEDGIVKAGCISFIDYSKAGKCGVPDVTTIARHDTDWKGLPGQLSHPHPHISPDGRYLAFNACHKGRTNLYIVDLESRTNIEK